MRRSVAGTKPKYLTQDSSAKRTSGRARSFPDGKVVGMLPSLLQTFGRRICLPRQLFEEGPETTVKPPPSPLLGEGKIPPPPAAPLGGVAVTRIEHAIMASTSADSGTS
jgi:hypothetical protein